MFACLLASDSTQHRACLLVVTQDSAWLAVLHVVVHDLGKRGNAVRDCPQDMG